MHGEVAAIYVGFNALTTPGCLQAVQRKACVQGSQLRTQDADWQP